ncbi:MAG: hypothetical protein NTZ38_01540, partial [Candidatus Taylorbacteria bacterium]|nr:hypothetical protein [Candidatus Taylorbacteria bacterium]
MYRMKTNEGIKSPFESWEIGIVAEPMFQMSQPNGKPFEMIVIAHRESYFIINTRVFDNNANITDVLL